MITMTMWNRSILCIGLALSFTAFQILHGQDSTATISHELSDSVPDSVRLLNARCDTIAADITRDGFGAMVVRASDSVKMLARCPNAAAKVVSNAWKTVTVDSAELSTLMWLSVSVRDRRIEDAAVANLKDKSRPVLVRRAILRVLIGYLENDVGVLKRVKRDSSDTTTAVRWYVGFLSFAELDVHQIDGAEPFKHLAYRQRMLKTIYELAMAASPDDRGYFRNPDDRDMYGSLRQTFYRFTPRRGL